MGKHLHNSLETLAINLRWILDKRQKSARATADATPSKMSNKTVSNMINAAHNTTIGSADEVCEVIDVPLWQLLCPFFPRGAIDEAGLARLINDYLASDNAGRASLEHIASSLAMKKGSNLAG